MVPPRAADCLTNPGCLAYCIQLNFNWFQLAFECPHGMARRWLMRSLLLTLVALTAYPAGLRGDVGPLAIAWNDYGAGTGMLGIISGSAPWGGQRDPIPVGLDSVLQSAFGKLFVMSAADRSVSVVDPVAWTVERSYALGPGDELVDLKVVSPQVAYVTRRNAKQLLRLDLALGTTQEVVDLGILADSDGMPEQGTMAIHEGRLFIQIQRVNFDDPAATGQPFIAVMDLDSQHLIDVDAVRDGLQAIELQGTFPKMKMQVVESTRKLFVSATGAFFDAGGIEVLDLDNLRTEGLAIRESDGLTGADLGAFVMVGPDRGFLAYSTDLLLSSHLHQFSLSGEVEPTELAVAVDYFSPAIEYHPGTNTVFFPIGGNVDTGLHVFDANTGARLSERLIPTSGPPTDLIVMAAVPEPAGLQLAPFALLAFASAAHKRRR
jgi:hypothetical protein